ncbi:acetaldehyde dehydrogenase (acetylating) [Fournierella sp.]|uniref:acetaldehyde dehydrogenase (acetylating) n=1 Tax=Allofournierella sp. TaxID=1940256 RepID=UPI0025C65F79|nr:acetaldehyde dehydrogenase (acetylating) [Fournierella sp.]
MALDRDLQSIQEVRDLIAKAKVAQKEYATWDQARVDVLVKAIADACIAKVEPLAKMAVEETGFGIWQDKVIKNLLGSKITYEYIKDMKTVGVIREDKEKKLMEVAVPVGIVAALIPSTNPTSTTMYKTLISLKAGNAIIVSPHPNAKKCILETVRIIQEAAKKAGAPDGLIGCVETTTMQATDALMKHPDTGIILATGGSAMVKAAYSSGNPALGVGPGNGPSFIERSADIPAAVKHIMDSKTFDNGTICASEQSIVTESCIADKVKEEVKRQGGYFLNEEQSKKLEKMIMRANNTMNPAIVGKSVQTIARMAGITVPEGTRVLVSEQTEVGPKHPYSREKLCPILAFFVEPDWEKACEKSIQILQNEGAGHTMTIHSQNEAVIREFALKKPVSRLLVNTPGALGGVGATTGLAPALTLGCGAVGGSATSDNISPLNLFNIRRVAWGLCELDDLRAQAGMAQQPAGCASGSCAAGAGLNSSDVERITREILAAVLKKN